MARSHPVHTPADEGARITLIKPQVESVASALQYGVLVGKILAPKALNRVGVKNNRWKMWDNMQGLHVMDLASNAFAITFPSKNQAGLVLAKAPWYVMGHLLSLQPRGEDQASMEISFSEVEEEFLRRKKQKREAWFVDTGNVVCVAITAPGGMQTYVPVEEGNLVPPSP